MNIKLNVNVPNDFNRSPCISSKGVPLPAPYDPTMPINHGNWEQFTISVPVCITISLINCPLISRWPVCVALNSVQL